MYYWHNPSWRVMFQNASKKFLTSPHRLLQNSPKIRRLLVRQNNLTVAKIRNNDLATEDVSNLILLPLINLTLCFSNNITGRITAFSNQGIVLNLIRRSDPRDNHTKVRRAPQKRTLEKWWGPLLITKICVLPCTYKQSTLTMNMTIYIKYSNLFQMFVLVMNSIVVGAKPILYQNKIPVY